MNDFLMNPLQRNLKVTSSCDGKQSPIVGSWDSPRQRWCSTGNWPMWRGTRPCFLVKAARLLKEKRRVCSLYEFFSGELEHMYSSMRWWVLWVDGGFPSCISIKYIQPYDMDVYDYQNNSEYVCVCDFMHQCIRFLDSKFSSSSLSQVVCAPEEGSENPQFPVTSGIIEGSNELNFKEEGTRMSLIPMTFGFLRPRK